MWFPKGFFFLKKISHLERFSTSSYLTQMELIFFFQLLRSPCPACDCPRCASRRRIPVLVGLISIISLLLRDYSFTLYISSDLKTGV